MKQFEEMFANLVLYDKQALLVLTTFPGLEPLYPELLKKVEISTIGFAAIAFKLETKYLAAVALATYLDDGLHWILRTKVTPDFTQAKEELLTMQAWVEKTVEKTGGAGPVFNS